MADRITSQFGTDISLCGVATAGIAIGALVADEMRIPFAYCRPKPKEHGMKNQLEGRLDPSKPIVVVEDLISTGGSSLQVVEYLRSSDYSVVGLAALFSYGFEISERLFKERNCPYFALSDYMHLLPLAILSGAISENDIETLTAWRNDPSRWNPQ